MISSYVPELKLKCLEICLRTTLLWKITHRLSSIGSLIFEYFSFFELDSLEIHGSRTCCSLKFLCSGMRYQRPSCMTGCNRFLRCNHLSEPIHSKKCKRNTISEYRLHQRFLVKPYKVSTKFNCEVLANINCQNCFSRNVIPWNVCDIGGGIIFLFGM